MEDKSKEKALGILQSYLQPEFKEEAKEDNKEWKLKYAVSGTYKDGTKWQRPATPEEEAELKSWAN